MSFHFRDPNDPIGGAQVPYTSYGDTGFGDPYGAPQSGGFGAPGNTGFSSVLQGILSGGDSGFGPRGLGTNLPELSTGGPFANALEGILSPGGRFGGEPGGDSTVPNVGGMSGLEKAALISTIVGGLGNIYGEYKRGRARDREFGLVEEQQKRKQALAAMLQPYLEEVLARQPGGAASA